MVATSIISTINVLWPPLKSSLAPILVKIRSVKAIFADFAGTKHPMCAISVMIATCRIYVDLPAIFGPVIIIVRLSESSSSVSFGTYAPLSSNVSTTGCLPSSMSIHLIFLLISGFTYLFATETFARDTRQSSALNACAFDWSFARLSQHIDLSSAKILSSSAKALDSAESIFSSSCLSSSVMYLSPFTNVCLRS